MAACLLVLQYVVIEMSYDDFHTQADIYYRVAGRRYVAGQLDGETAQSLSCCRPAMKKGFPEIAQLHQNQAAGMAIPW
jgi:putative ABC transport system permease protein